MCGMATLTIEVSISSSIAAMVTAMPMRAQNQRSVAVGALFRFAALKVTPEAERVCFERLKPWCLFLREAECNGDLPRRLYYVDDFDRGALADMFPEIARLHRAARDTHRRRRR